MDLLCFCSVLCLLCFVRVCLYVLVNESQEVSPFQAGDHKAHKNRRAQNKANTRQNKNIRDRTKTLKIHKSSTALERSVKYFTGGLKPV